MSILWAAFLGLVQGVAEFLPISSSGHLSILQNLFGAETTEGHLFFDVLLHFGTLISVVIMYRRDIMAMIREIPGLLRLVTSKEERSARQPAPRRMILMLILATLPLVLVLPINDRIEQLYYSTVFIGCVLIITGFMLRASDRMLSRGVKASNMTPVQAIIIGLCQAVATLPGLSRSGTTITAGLAVGLDRSFAVRFSFLLSLPAVLGATLLHLIDAAKSGIDASLLPAYIIGMAVAAVSGCFAIGLIQRLTRKGGLGKFSIYCWGVGAAAIILSFIL